MSQSTLPLVTMKGVSKSFGPVTVLQGIDLTVEPGEIVALVGENGAGKSTLLSIITGIHQASSGDTQVLGHQVGSGWSPLAAREAGVDSVHQEISLNPYQTVAENIFMGEWPTRLGVADRKSMFEESTKLLERVRLRVDPQAVVKDLDLGSQQLVELAKALRSKPTLLVLDEATSALDEDQVKSVFAVAKDVAASGGAVMIVSHRMQELFEVSSKMVVLKDGVITGVVDSAGATEAEVVQLMLGRELSQVFPEKATLESRENAPILHADSVYTLEEQTISLSVRPGWILGLGGLQGQGQREVMRALFGLGELPATFTIGDNSVKVSNPRQAIAHRIAFVPDDRKREGVQVDRSVSANLSLPSLRELSIPWLGGSVKSKAEKSLVSELIDQLNIKVASTNQKVRFLSGGNQQKISLSKWLPNEPRVLLLAEPTRGIDVGTKVEIYQLLRSLAINGVGILITSGDTMELVGICDEVLVMYEGKEVSRLYGDSLTEETLVRASVTGERTSDYDETESAK